MLPRENQWSHSHQPHTRSQSIHYYWGNRTLCNWQYLDWVHFYWASLCPLIESLCPRSCLIVLTYNAEIADIAILPESRPRPHHASALRGLREGHHLPPQLLLKYKGHLKIFFQILVLLTFICDDIYFHILPLEKFVETFPATASHPGRRTLSWQV